MKPQAFELIKSQFVMCKPGPDVRMWDLCSSNYWRLLAYSELMRNCLHHILTSPVPQGQDAAVLIGIRAMAADILNGKIEEGMSPR
jgi:hypothetical protein